MKRHLICLISALALILSLSQGSTADIVSTFTYDFSTGDQDASGPQSGSNPYVMANPYVARANNENLESDSGIEAQQAVVYGHITPNPPGGPATTWQTFSATAINSGRFDVVSVGFQYDLKGLIASSPFFTGIMQVDLLGSIDGFATPGINLGSAQFVKDSSDVPPAMDLLFTVTDPTFQNVTGTVDFRLAFTDTLTGADNDSAHVIDNVALTVDGSMIPEPATGIVFGLMMVAGVLVRRRS